MSVTLDSNYVADCAPVLKMQQAAAALRAAEELVADTDDTLGYKLARIVRSINQLQDSAIEAQPEIILGDTELTQDDISKAFAERSKKNERFWDKPLKARFHS